MRRIFLYGMLAGALTVTSAFLVRDAADDYAMLKMRVSYIEGYISALDRALRSR